MKRALANFIASGFYSGYLPKAPGTWGSLAAFIISFFAQDIFGLNILLMLAFISFIIGWVVSQYLVNLSPDDLDPSYIVIDEFSGSFLIVWLLSHAFEGMNLGMIPLYVISFVLFRLFDMVKVFPINWVEHHLSRTVSLAGFSIMVDDILAALYPYFIILLIRPYL